MIIDGISTDIAVNLTGKKVTIKERWKYEPLTFATPSSTNEWNEINIDVYPNPAYDLLNVSIKGLKMAGDVLATIKNIDGKVMADVGINKEVTNIEIEELPTGIYTLQVMNQNLVIFVTKFIKIQ